MKDHSNIGYNNVTGCHVPAVEPELKPRLLLKSRRFCGDVAQIANHVLGRGWLRSVTYGRLLSVVGSISCIRHDRLLSEICTDPYGIVI